MRKILLVTLLCGGAFFNMKAQVAQPLSIGIKAGGSLSTSSIDNYTMRGGLNAGVVVDYNLNKNLFFRSGVEFTMKGGKYDQNFESIGTSSIIERGREVRSIHLNYIQVPLMFGYRKDIGQGINIYAAGGLYGAVAVYGKGKFNYSTNLTGGNMNYVYDNFDDLNLKKMDFGVLGSIGVEYQQYSINVGYEYGFVNINKTKSSDSFEKNPAYYITRGDSWHNMNATCTLGYKF